MNLPIVTVIIPTYNYAIYIPEAINSVLNQTYPPELVEIIIVDDGSTDNTKEVLQLFVQNPLIRYYYQDNKGKASATFYAIQKSNGKYIFNLDADDWFLPGKISNTVNVFESDESIVHVASPAKIYFQENNKWDVENLPGYFLQNVMDGKWLLHRFYNSNILYGGGSTYAAKASVLKSILIPAEVDMFIDELLLLAILPFGKSFFVETPLSAWRVHSNNYSGKVSVKEQQLKKEQRLISSSASVLSYLINNRFDKELIKIYKVKHATRRIAFKENSDTKKITDIIQYSSEIYRLKPNWKIIKNYNVINRLIPSSLFRLLKKIKTAIRLGK